MHMVDIPLSGEITRAVVRPLDDERFSVREAAEAFCSRGSHPGPIVEAVVRRDP